MEQKTVEVRQESYLFGNYIKWILLTIVTLGIYSFWLGINMKKWVVKHTHFED